MSDKRTSASMSKRGGYSGSKPASQMKPPTHRPAAVKPAAKRPSSNGQEK